MGAPGQASVKADVVKLLEGEKAKLVQNPPSGGFQKKCILLERMMGIVRQYEGAIQSPADVDSLPGATIEMKKRFKKLLDEVLNPGYLPKWGSGGHALLVAMLKAKQQGIMEMPIEEIKDAAEATHLCKHSFYSKGGQAWKAMAELEREKLVARKTGAIMHKPGLYFTNVAGSQHKLRLTAKGVRVAERMFFLAGSNRSAAPFESQSPAAVDKNQVPVAPSAPVKKRPKKDNVVKHLESPKQVIPSSGRNLPDWMTKAKKRPRVTSSNTTGTGAICDRNVVRKLFLDEIKGEVKGEAKHEVKKEVKVEKQEEKLSEWARPAVRAAVSGKMGLGNTMRYATVKEEKDVVKSKFDLEDAVASRMGQPFQVHIKNVQVKKEVT